VKGKGQTDDPGVELTEPMVAGPMEPPPPSKPDALTTAARLVLGTASLGIEALTSRLQEWGRQAAAAEATGATTPAPEGEADASATDLAIAFAARGARTAASLGATAARGLRTAAGATDVLGRLVPDFMNEPLDRTREQARRRIRRLESLGREELDRSRAIARAALDDGLDSLFARLADSRELQFVIRAQSVTAAEDAVDGIRDRASGIDDRLEAAARKLLGKQPRPPASASR
jgi:hypothetical protein